MEKLSFFWVGKGNFLIQPSQMKSVGEDGKRRSKEIFLLLWVLFCFVLLFVLCFWFCLLACLLLFASYCGGHGRDERRIWGTGR